MAQAKFNMMKFDNRLNEELTLDDGRVVWLSRSSTVIITVWCFIENTPYLLLGERGIGCPNEVGKWNLPCGYLDWNETLYSQLRRAILRT